jgi:large subunit ribosomal protein L22
MADEKDKKEKTAAKEGAKESKADAPEAKAKAAKKPAAKKDAEKKPAKKAAAKKDSKDAKDKPAKKESKKAEPKADKKEAKGKEGEKPAKKPRRRAKKADAKAEEKKPAPSRRRRPGSDELPVVRASAKYVRVAPRKARLIADQVRGLHIEQARALLAFSPRGAARDIHKLIDSAAANAENNHDLIGDEMKITSITVDEGPTLRRFRPRALGRATPINKRTSHIAVALTPVEDD